jgi:putative transposase
MSQYEVAAHCRYYIRYHIVWIVKCRKELLIKDKVVQRLVKLLNQIGIKYETPVEEIGADKDHLHLFCHGLPRVSPATIVRQFKSISARELRKEFPELKQQTYGAGLWG